MRQYRIYLAVALAFAGVTAGVMSLIGTDRYYPLAQVYLPDQSTLTFIDRPWTEAKRCRETTQKMAAGARANCPQCRIEDSCPTRLDALWLQALSGQMIDRYVVQSGSLRIVIGAGGTSEAICMAMAEQISRDKKLAARCVPPQRGT